MEKRLKDEKSSNKSGAAAQEEPQAADNQSYDDIIGSFGKYQLLIFVFKILIGVTSAFNNLGVTFFAPSDFISFWCADNPAQALAPAAINSTAFYALQNARQFDANYLDNQTLLSYRAPAVVEAASGSPAVGHLLSEFMFSEERRHRHSLKTDYDTPRSLRKECSFVSLADNQRHKCTAYKYDTGIWMSTIIDEWDLVCDRSWFISVTQSLYMAGFIVSFLVFGYLSDRFGRWNSLLVGASIEVLSGFGCAFAGSITSFMVFRFLVGLGNAGRSSSAYLIMIEWTGGSWRMHISTLGSLGWIIGYCSMPWITLFFLHFRHMQLFVCLYELVFIVWLLRLPESPRWLLAHRKFDEAHSVLLMAAKFNGLVLEASHKKATTAVDEDHSTASLSYASALTSVATENSGKPPLEALQDIEAPRQVNAFSLGPLTNWLARADHLQPYTMDEFERRFKRLASTMEAKEFTKKEDRLSIVDLFKWPNLRKYALILAFAWAVNSFVYYGIALNVGTFGARNLFVAFTYAGITELPAIAFSILCMKCFPRRTTNVLLFSTILVLCALQVPLKYYDLQNLQQVTMLLAKLFNSCSFTCILYQSMELFPTSIRQTAYSSCALAGRIGSILAPFIKELSQRTNNLVPPVIYAALSVAEILLIRNLPETQGVELPDTMLEAEKFRGTDRQQGAAVSEQDLATAQISPPAEVRGAAPRRP